MSLRLIYLIERPDRWSETFIHREIDYLATHASPVDILPVTIWPTASDTVPDVLSSITCLGDTPMPRRLSFSPTSLGRINRTMPASFLNRINRFRRRKLINRLAALADAQQAGHIHAAFGGLSAFVAAEACSMLPKPLPFSISLHAQDYFCVGSHYHTYLQKAAAIFACNRNLYQHLTTTFPALAPRVHLIHHGLDLTEWPYSPPRPPREPLQFLFAGRLVDKKSPQTAVAWVKALEDAGITARLTIVGDGPLRDQVPTIGIRNPAEIRELMNQAHFLLVPSRQTPDGDREGIPNVILEAMATGLPVIATASGSISEILTPDTGFLLPDPSPASFVELIRQLILPSGIQKLNGCCEQARRCIEEEFDLSCNIQEKIRIWNRLAATETKDI